MKFTISSGPFNVPLVKHVIVAMGDSYIEATWNWEVLKSELYTHFPHLRSTKAYCMASEYDNDSRMYCENVLFFIECDSEILKDICVRMKGEYLTHAEVRV
ncbi:hypothetical protein MettiDRAFT_2637 [Methanolobus tindarius DSM 2278]|uniref:Uncharacterized protein n=1 Tax=Methanolobus tindarius DSM 2278 TaxID=1090322 RepID=W9DTN0_METTI|nr:hypothetical protein [Methanolobus tindarius]ETA69143.1 hypothetical protein MettiDRAFT_2637 [Methanolobus tindarius DSM 2278]